MTPDLVGTSLPELLAHAAAVRDGAHGTRITYSPKVFIPLTQLCRDRCGYCTFAKAPARIESPVPHARPGPRDRPRGRGRRLPRGALHLGRAPRGALSGGGRRGWPSTGTRRRSTTSSPCAGSSSRRPGLLPHANAGALFPDELAALRPVSASQGMMLESLNPDARLPPRARPTRRPRAASPRSTRRASSPSRSPPASSSASARRAPTASRRSRPSPQSHRRHGHVQEVIVQNFLPKPGTVDARRAAVPRRRVPRGDRARPAHPARPTSTCRPRPTCRRTSAACWTRASTTGAACRRSRPTTSTPSVPWPALDRLRAVTEAAGFTLAPGSPIYPEYARRARALARPRHAVPGARPQPTPKGSAATTSRGTRAARARPRACSPPSPRAGGAVGEVLAGVLLGQEADVDEIVALFSARGPEVAAVAEVADDLRRQTVGDVVTWVANRNINYTNICTFKCRFCAFSKGPLSLNLRGDPYLLGVDEIQRRVVEAVECRRDRGVPAGRHPPELRRRLLHRRVPRR